VGLCYLVRSAAEFADNAARVLLDILSQGVVAFADTATTDTTLNDYSHGFTGAPLGQCSSLSLFLRTHCLGPLSHGRTVYE